MRESTLDFGLWDELGRRAPLAVIATDLDGVVVVWSAGAESLYGWSADETLGRPIQEITVGPLERGVAQEIMDQVVRGEPWEGDFHARQRNGEMVEVHVLDLPVFDDDGAPCGIVGLSFAIDEGRRAGPLEDVISLASQIRESRVRERTRLARVLHDEIGQLIAAARTEALAVADSAAGGADTNVTEYLDRAIAQIRRESSALLESQIDVWEMVLRCYELSRDLHSRTGILVDCRIKGSAQHFEQIATDAAVTAFSAVREALRNAERHAMARHIEVTVEADCDGLTVLVIDDGAGTRPIRPGTGLRILRESVEQVGGRCEVQRVNEGGISGTEARVWIPTSGRRVS